MEELPLELSFHILASLTTRQVLGLQRVSRACNALAMSYLAQAKAIELTSVARVVREAVARLLPHMPGLRFLNAARCYKLTSADLATVLKCCPQLQALHLQTRDSRHPQSCRIADQALRSIVAANPPLRSLNVRDCMLLTDKGMDDLLTHFTRLQYLNMFSNCNIQQVGIGATDSLDSLRLLNVSRTSVRGKALQDVAKRLPNLFHLNLEGCSQVDEAWLKTCFASTCPALTSLNLSWNSRVNDRCMTIVAEMLPNLCSLELENCYEITDQGVGEIAAHCAKLENLHLEQCFKITDQSLDLLAHSCPALRFLRIRGCGNLTAQGLAAFADLLPRCRVLQEKGQRKEYHLVIPEDPLAPLTFL